MRSSIYALTFGLCLVMACSSSSEHTKKTTTKAAQEKDLLDEEVNIKRKRVMRTRKSSNTTMVLPKAPAKPSMAIDGKFEGWDAKSLRVFGGKGSVETGEAFWSNNDDASMRIGVKADQGFAYFWLEVKDDVILEKDVNKTPVDGIVLYIKDPRLDTTLAALPKGIKKNTQITTETALVFNPSGRTRLYPSNSAEYPSGTVYTEAFRTKKGYGVEVAIKLELLSHVSTLPLEKLAFRVEMLDGDEKNRPGTQTRLSMFPRKANEAPQYARFQAGMLPHAPIKAIPSRPDGLGYWSRGAKQWSYTSFEVMPKYWFYMTDTSAMETMLKKQDLYKTFCNKARFDPTLIEGYQSRSGNHQVGLLVCAAREVKNACPDKAQSRVFWVHLHKDEGTWGIKRQVEVFPKAMPQCLNKPVKNEAFRGQFAMFPLEFLGPHTWAIGWTERQEADNYLATAKKVAIFHTKRTKAQIAELTPERVVSDELTRTISTAGAYFVEIDGNSGHDICEIEVLDEQVCRKFNGQCKTRKHGRSKLTHIKMWSKSKQSFEPYMLSKHKNCPHNFDFSKSDGYMLIHLGNRIGLLPSPEDEDEGEGF